MFILDFIFSTYVLYRHFIYLFPYLNCLLICNFRICLLFACNLALYNHLLKNGAFFILKSCQFNHNIASFFLIQIVASAQGGAVAQSVERTTPGEEILGSIPAVAARSLLLGRCQYNVTVCDRSHGLPALSLVWQHEKLSDVNLGTRPRYRLVVDEDVNNLTKPTKPRISAMYLL